MLPSPRRSLSLVLLATTACGSDPTASNAALSPDANTLMQALCQRIVECHDETPIFTDTAACVQFFVTRYECDPRQARANVDALSACVQGMADLPCGRVLEDFPTRACIPAFASFEHELGYALNDEVCSDDVRCVAGASCHYTSECGVCMPEQVAGDPCQDECQGGNLFCNDAGKCEILRGDGEACSEDDQCIADACLEGKCRGIHLGDACIEGIYCGDALRCVAGECAPLAQLGEKCEDVDDDIPACVYDAACLDGRCVAIAGCGEGKRDSACSSDAQCSAGLSCSSLYERCTERAGEGEECSADDVQCAAGLRCDWDDDSDLGTCRKASEVDAPEPIMCE